MVLRRDGVYSYERLNCRAVRSAIHFSRFREPKGFPGQTDTPCAFETERESEFRRKFNLSLNRPPQDIGGETFFLRETVYFYRNGDRNKADFKRQRHGAIIGRFVRKGALIYYRRTSIAVYLGAPSPKIRPPTP